jgi:hypothetical protein
MNPHDPDGIAAAWTMLVLHAMQPRVRWAAGTRGAVRADLIDRPQVVVPAPPPGCPAASIPARPGRP